MAFTHILVPTDFSAPAKQALRYALEEATLHHAQVTLLHVLPPHTGTEVYSHRWGAADGGRFRSRPGGPPWCSTPATAHRRAPGSR